MRELGYVLAVSLLVTVPLAAADPSETPVSLRFVDQPASQVLEALFTAGGVRGAIDPCVSGRISITLHNVNLGMALDAVARMAQLEIVRGGGEAGYRVTCRNVEERRDPPRTSSRSARPVDLRFRLERTGVDGLPETRAEPRLRVAVGEPAEISESGDIASYDLGADGELVVKRKQPEWSLRVATLAWGRVVPTEIRGILSLGMESTQEPDAVVVTATKPFRAPLGDEVHLATLEFGGATWTLTLAEVD